MSANVFHKKEWPTKISVNPGKILNDHNLNRILNGILNETINWILNGIVNGILNETIN
jgi:hypothetical protein